MKAAFLEGDKEKNDDILRPLFAALNEDIGLSVLELGSSEGDVFARAHNPEKFGDNKSDNLSVAAALNGESVSGVEMGSSGLAIRAVVPIKDNDRIIGTFQVGFDVSVLTDIQHAINGDISLYNEDVLAQTSNENRQSDVGTALDDAAIYQRVSNGELVEIPPAFLFRQTRVPIPINKWCWQSTKLLLEAVRWPKRSQRPTKQSKQWQGTLRMQAREWKPRPILPHNRWKW